MYTSCAAEAGGGNKRCPLPHPASLPPPPPRPAPPRPATLWIHPLRVDINAPKLLP